jgi:hypothetical protein
MAPYREFELLVGVLPTVVSPGAIWTEIEAGFHIELETAVRIDVLPDQRRDGAQIRRAELRRLGDDSSCTSARASPPFFGRARVAQAKKTCRSESV